MSFIPNEKVVEPVIVNDGFFPDVDPAAFIDAIRIDEAIDPATIRHMLTLAVRRINIDLALYKAAKILAGTTTLAAVPAGEIDGVSVKVFDYFDGVYSFAKATLLETYSDTDSTLIAEGNLDQKANAADPHKRRAYEAIQRILGEPRAQVELI